MASNTSSTHLVNITYPILYERYAFYSVARVLLMFGLLPPRDGACCCMFRFVNSICRGRTVTLYRSSIFLISIVPILAICPATGSSAPHMSSTDCIGIAFVLEGVGCIHKICSDSVVAMLETLFKEYTTVPVPPRTTVAS
jgi:hypothetical protein